MPLGPDLVHKISLAIDGSFAVRMSSYGKGDQFAYIYIPLISSFPVPPICFLPKTRLVRDEQPSSCITCLYTSLSPGSHFGDVREAIRYRMRPTFTSSCNSNRASMTCSSLGFREYIYKLAVLDHYLRNGKKISFSAACLRITMSRTWVTKFH